MDFSVGDLVEVTDASCPAGKHMIASCWKWLIGQQLTVVELMPGKDICGCEHVKVDLTPLEERARANNGNGGRDALIATACIKHVLEPNVRYNKAKPLSDKRLTIGGLGI